MSEKNTFYSFKELKEAFEEENKENLKVQKIFKRYGIAMPLEEISNIEIIERNRYLITYLNKKTNEIITSNLFGKVYEKYNSEYSVSLTTFKRAKKLFIEHFNSIEPARNYEEAGKNALKSRNNPKTKLLSRAYADVSTKYGDFCLHIEEGYTNYGFGPYLFISLYHGNHNDIIIEHKNDFNFHRYGLFKCKYENNFNQWIMGFVNEKFEVPKINIWNYEKPNLNSSIYAFRDSKKIDAGVILNDGKLKLEDNLREIPYDFDNDRIIKALKEYENLDCTSKAYFIGDNGIIITILKKEFELNIECKKLNFESRNYENIFSNKILSNTNKEFTKDDFEKIIIKLKDFPLSDKLKEFIISELITYINIHKEDDFELLESSSLKSYSFESMLEYLEKEDLTLIIENGIEAISRTFNISIEDLLGQSPFNNDKKLKYENNDKKI